MRYSERMTSTCTHENYSAPRFDGTATCAGCGATLGGSADPVTEARLMDEHDAAAGDAADALPDMDEAPHVDYPHTPGYLFDCAACESRCHCTPGHAECVYAGQHHTTTATEES